MVFRASRVAMGKVVMMAWLLAFLALSTTIALAGINEDLIAAAKQGDLPKVKRLLAKGAEVNAKEKDGMTALIHASAVGHREIVQALLATGADINAKTKDGETALMLATQKGHREVVELLLKAGAK